MVYVRCTHLSPATILHRWCSIVVDRFNMCSRWLIQLRNRKCSVLFRFADGCCVMHHILCMCMHFGVVIEILVCIGYVTPRWYVVRQSEL